MRDKDKVRIAYFDCFSGISGDMILGALIDAGVKVQRLEEELSKLNLKGYRIKARKVKRHSIAGRQFQVDLAKRGTDDRGLEEILGLIERSRLDEDVKRRCIQIFKKLGKAEAAVHGKREAHFHEVGAVDSIIDVVGSVVGLKLLGVEKVYSSVLSLGRGWVRCRGGRLPVPAPATLELVKGIPVMFSREDGELVTPTGAAVISTLAESFERVPPMKIEQIGYGAGQRKLPDRPNLLRVLIGQSTDNYERDEMVVIESNIDDMSPQIYDYLQEKLFEAGAADVFLTAVQMKKNRPGILLTILSEPDKVTKLTEVIFTETSTLGVRTYMVSRQRLPRKIVEVRTKYGSVRVKVARGRVFPEYDDCRRIAQRRKIPLQRVYEEARSSYVGNH